VEIKKASFSGILKGFRGASSKNIKNIFVGKKWHTPITGPVKYFKNLNIKNLK
jgi:hypothetical protein